MGAQLQDNKDNTMLLCRFHSGLSVLLLIFFVMLVRCSFVLDKVHYVVVAIYVSIR